MKGEAPSTLTLGLNLKAYCVNPQKQRVGLSDKDLPPPLRKLIKMVESQVWEERLVCSMKVGRILDEAAVEYPELEEFINALERKCEKCPYDNIE